MNIYDEIFATEPKYDGPVGYKLNIVLEWVKKNGFREVLDVGCGRGHYIRMLSKNNIKVTGLDSSQYIIETLKDYDVINNDILGQAANGRKWEAIICMDVLEHIDSGKIEETIKALSTLSKHALLGIANHSDIWHGVELHPIQQKPLWWKGKLVESFGEANLIYESDRYFIFDVRTK